MTAEEERQFKKDMLLEFEEQSHQLRVLEGPIRDWGTKLSGLGFRLGKESLTEADLETVKRLAELPAMITEYERLRERVKELAERRQRIFPS
jgi:hypothetical protein